MKALTLYQPWATLVAIGEKRIETRSWGTRYRCPLAIHVSKHKKMDAQMCWAEPFASALEGTLVHIGPVDMNYFGLRQTGTTYQILTDNLHLGCVIATCDLVACVQVKVLNCLSRDIEEVKWGDHYWALSKTEKAFGDFSPERYLWFLDNVKLLPEPIPAKGMVGLWEWSGG